MRRMTFLTICLIFVAAHPAAADNTKELLREAIQLLEAGEWTEAREVIAIALDQVDHHMLDTTASTFPLEAGVFERGEVETQKAVGIDLTRCTYTDPEGKTIDVQLMGGAGGALGNLAEMGAAFGGARKVRHHGRSGSLLEETGKVTLTLKLKCGKSLMFESRDFSGDGVVAFVEGFPVVEIDDSAS